MLELIFQGFVEWLYGLLVETWEYFISTFMDILSVDFHYLKTNIPVIPDIMQVILALGWALLLGNLVFQATRSMLTGLGFEGEDPKLLFTRSFVFAFLLLASPQICELALDMTSAVIDLLDVDVALDVHLVAVGGFDGIKAEWMLIIIFNMFLMFKIFRMMLEIVEQYLVLAFLTICAPLAFGVGGSRSTSDIFTGWCRMFASMCFVIVSNMIFFKLLLSLLGHMRVGPDILLWVALVFAVTKLARKVDALITRIGLNPMMTGDGLGGRSLPGMLAFTVARTMVSQVVKSVGQSAGGTQGSSGGNSGAGAGGGKPNFRGPTGGAAAAGVGQRTTSSQNSASSSQQSAATHTATAQNTAQNGGEQWTPAGRGVDVRPDDSESAAMEGAAPVTNINTQAQPSNPSGKGPERKSSVPPGAVRGANHVKQGGAKVGGVSTNSVKTNAVNSSRNMTSRPGQAAPGAAAAVPGANVSTEKDGKARTTAGTVGSGMRAGVGSGNMPRPGMAGTGAGAKDRAASIRGMTSRSGKAGGGTTSGPGAAHGEGRATRPGTAGTGEGSNTNVIRGGGQAPGSSPEGIGSQSVSRFTNVPHTAQNQTVRNSVQSDQQNNASVDGARQTSVTNAGRGAAAAPPGANVSAANKEDRFTQRTAAVQPPINGTGSQPGTAGTAQTAQSAQPAPAAKESQRMGGAGHSAVPPIPGQASSPAQQESRISRQSGAGVSGRQAAPSARPGAPARQETRAQRHVSGTAAAKSGAQASNPARQESRPPKQTNAKVRGMASAAAKHPGTAGTAPPAARPSRKDLPETRPPRPEDAMPDAKENPGAADAAPDETDVKEDGGDV